MEKKNKRHEDRYIEREMEKKDKGHEDRDRERERDDKIDKPRSVREKIEKRDLGTINVTNMQ